MREMKVKTVLVSCGDRKEVISMVRRRDSLEV